MAGLLLLLRRLAGGFAAPHSAVIPWAVAAGGIPLVFLVGAAARFGGDRRPVWLARGGLIAAALAVVPVGGPAAWPTRAVGLVGAVAALVAALQPVGGWRPPRLSGFRPARGPSDDLAGRPGAEGGDRDRPSDVPAGPHQSPQAMSVAWPITDGARVEAPAERFRQRLERYETPAGEDCVRGQVMLSVAAGSRTGHAHVGFCPAFATLPAVEVTTDCDFVEAEVTAAEVLPWGVRVECRLSEPAEEPLEILVVLRAIRPA